MTLDLPAYQSFSDGIERTDFVRMKRQVSGGIYGQHGWILTDGIERTELNGRISLELSRRKRPSVGRSVGRSVGWPVGWSVGRSVGQSVGRLAGRPLACLVGRLVGWSVGLQKILKNKKDEVSRVI